MAKFCVTRDKKIPVVGCEGGIQAIYDSTPLSYPMDESIQRSTRTPARRVMKSCLRVIQIR